MPKRRDSVPKYGLHKPTGQARVVLNGRSFYLGKYGTEESWQEYARITREWLVNSHRVSAMAEGRSDLTIIELIAAYWRHVQSYYVKNGKPTGEQVNTRQALRPLERLYGLARAADFGPLALETV